MHVLLPPNWLARQLGGRLGVAKAVVLGIPLPLCSCAVIPVGLSLRQSGASRGSVVGFLTATPQTGVDSIFVSAGMLGWPFAIFKVVVALITGLVAGLLVDSTVLADRTLGITSAVAPSTRRGPLNEFISHVDTILRSIWRWLVVGVLASALLTTLLPTDGLQSLSAYGPLPAMLLRLVISTPLYVCATASVPIAAALVAAGMPVGAALVFLMAGPATNVATMGAVYKTLGAKTLAIYLATIVVGSIVGGLLFQSIIAGTALDVHAHHHTWYGPAAASAVVLLGLFAWYAADELRLALLRRRAQHATGQAVAVRVEGMTCGGCVNKLTTALLADPRIDAVDVQLSPGSATVVGQVDADELRRLVEQAGFQAP
jgi:uncharacterized membrane protein YraQ (UPF0718 family)/copper chaperone CopZ